MTVQINLIHVLTEPLFFTKGVKQGCSLSPMLLSFYIDNLEDALNSTNLGGCMRSVILSVLFFADDLALISSTPKVGMNKLLAIISEFCQDMMMGLCASKTYMLLSGGRVVVLKVGIY